MCTCAYIYIYMSTNASKHMKNTKQNLLFFLSCQPTNNSRTIGADVMTWKIKLRKVIVETSTMKRQRWQMGKTSKSPQMRFFRSIS